MSSSSLSLPLFSSPAHPSPLPPGISENQMRFTVYVYSLTVRGDMGLDSLQGRRDKAKLYKVATMPEHRYAGVECEAT